MVNIVTLIRLYKTIGKTGYPMKCYPRSVVNFSNFKYPNIGVSEAETTTSQSEDRNELNQTVCSDQVSLQGTTIFINLPKKSDEFIKDLEWTLYKRGANIVDFLSKRVTHIIIDDHNVDYELSSFDKLIATKKYCRSVKLVKKSLKNSAQKVKNSVSCTDQAKKFGIKFVHISNIYNPTFDWAKGTVDKYHYTSKWLEDQS